RRQAVRSPAASCPRRRGSRGTHPVHAGRARAHPAHELRRAGRRGARREVLVNLPPGLRARLAELYPGATIVRVVALRDDETGGEEMKALGYGRPLKIELSGARTVVFHTARPDDFGHDRRSDRVGNLLLAFDTFAGVPHHVAAIDMGLVRD